ncbi:hypothetical protein WG70_20480 [Burkholderia oklahomensis EO147]|nr:hypothetical protein WG70_20480 [Burkholderia oklahomensis EO147]KUY50720.1 hypothetical protein WG70_17685 [Burkholderia oklahomensis EO147]
MRDARSPICLFARVEAVLDDSLARRDARRAQYVAPAREPIDPSMMPERDARVIATAQCGA